MAHQFQGGVPMTYRIQRLPDVLIERGRSRSSHYSDIEKGLFTRPIKIGQRAVGWPSSEVTELNMARIAGKTEAEIQQLVIELECKRTNSSSFKQANNEITSRETAQKEMV